MFYLKTLFFKRSHKVELINSKLNKLFWSDSGLIDGLWLYIFDYVLFNIFIKSIVPFSVITLSEYSVLLNLFFYNNKSNISNTSLFYDNYFLTKLLNISVFILLILIVVIFIN